MEALGRKADGPGTASAAVMEAKAKEKKDGVVKEVIRLERESVIPILKPKLVMKLAYLIGMYRCPLIRLCFLILVSFYRERHWAAPCVAFRGNDREIRCLLNFRSDSKGLRRSKLNYNRRY